MRRLLFLLFSVLTFSLYGQGHKSVLKKYPKSIHKIILQEDKVFRGSSFGDTKAAIKAKEPLKLHQESDTLLLYTLYLDADDSADLLYYFDADGKAKGFAIVFILNDSEEEQNLRKLLTNYYTEKYNSFTVINNEDELWDSKQGYLIEMRDTSDEAGMEIEIAYYPQ